MRNSYVLLGLGLAFVGLWAWGSSSDSSTGSAVWKTFDEGVLEARNSNKILLVDVYTDWCGWCKKMDKEVYANDEVRKILDEKFVSVKLNAESKEMVTYNGTPMTSAEFSRSVGVSGFPSTLFFDSSGKPITLLPGYVPAEKFGKILTFIGDGHHLTMSFPEFERRSL